MKRSEKEHLDFILKNELHKELQKAKQLDSLDAKNGIEHNRVTLFIKKYGIDIYKETRELLDSRSAKLGRIKRRILPLLESGRAIFVTLTFNDATLNNTNAQSRRKYVTRYLTPQCLDYVGNIDFGKDNEREHYHAIVVPTKKGGLSLDEWRNYGNINVKRIDASKGGFSRVSKYLTKLTYHATKKTTGNLGNLLYMKHPKADVDAVDSAPAWLSLSEEEYAFYFGNDF